MPLKNIFSYEFVEAYKSGQREFSSINLQYADLSCNLKDVVIRDSRLFFVTFRNCDIRDIKFVNCELVYPTFYGGQLQNAVFDRCSIEFSLIENTLIKNVKILKSKISWAAFFNIVASELDMTSSDRFKVFTNISQVTQRDVDEVMQQIGPLINSLDISIRHKVKQELYEGAKKYGTEIGETVGSRSAYPASERQYRTDSKSYGFNMQGISDIVIGAYNAAHPYKTKKADETDSRYK